MSNLKCALYKMQNTKLLISNPGYKSHCCASLSFVEKLANVQIKVAIKATKKFDDS